MNWTFNYDDRFVSERNYLYLPGLQYTPAHFRVIIERLCSKENFREPFGLPSVLAWVPRPNRWSPNLKFRLGCPGLLVGIFHVFLMEVRFRSVQVLFIKMFPSKIRKLFFALITQVEKKIRLRQMTEIPRRFPGKAAINFRNETCGSSKSFTFFE